MRKAFLALFFGCVLQEFAPIPDTFEFAPILFERSDEVRRVHEGMVAEKMTEVFKDPGFLLSLCGIAARPGTLNESRLSELVEDGLCINPRLGVYYYFGQHELAVMECEDSSGGNIAQYRFVCQRDNRINSI